MGLEARRRQIGLRNARTAERQRPNTAELSLPAYVVAKPSFAASSRNDARNATEGTPTTGSVSRTGTSPAVVNFLEPKSWLFLSRRSMPRRGRPRTS
jgi:hypothetical protein